MTALRLVVVLACWPAARAFDWASSNWQPMALRTALKRAKLAKAWRGETT